MSQTQRLRHIQTRLTPQQAVLAWLAKRISSPTWWLMASR